MRAIACYERCGSSNVRFPLTLQRDWTVRASSDHFLASLQNSLSFSLTQSCGATLEEESISSSDQLLPSKGVVWSAPSSSPSPLLLLLLFTMLLSSSLSFGPWPVPMTLTTRGFSEATSALSVILGAMLLLLLLATNDDSGRGGEVFCVTFRATRRLLFSPD